MSFTAWGLWPKNDTYVNISQYNSKREDTGTIYAYGFYGGAYLAQNVYLYIVQLQDNYNREVRFRQHSLFIVTEFSLYI